MIDKRWRPITSENIREGPEDFAKGAKESNGFFSRSSRNLRVLRVRLFNRRLHLNLGFNASRSQSPSRFTLSAISTSITPGKMVIHHSPENR